MPKDEQKPMTREELLAIIEQARRENWEELDLSNKGITELPPEIGQLKNLKKLDLENDWRNPGELRNKLTQLPDEIGQLTKLQTLNLFSNQLTALPESIGQLTSLQTLDLEQNQLTTLPESIGQLTKLSNLNIYSNKLTDLNVDFGKLKNLRELTFGVELRTKNWRIFPQGIRQLSKLETLAFGGLNITSLHDWLFELSNLKTLIAIDCELETLPSSIGYLINLEDLQIYGNKITFLPPSLARLKKLQQLDLSDNPLNPALKSAYKQGLPALMAYLRSLEQAEPLYEAKLVLVGEGGVGKTTLLKALTGKEPKQNEPTTHGVSIDIHSMHLPHPEKQGINIQFNAWDFGGQEVYRVTHQFFFSKRSVYLLVWEPRMGVQQCQVEDWLKLIRLRVGDDAKVIIVSTHAKTGERIARIDQPVFRRDYGSMIARRRRWTASCPTTACARFGSIILLRTSQSTRLSCILSSCA
jgi:small GTP-binding protein